VDKPAHWQFDQKLKKTFRPNLLCKNVLVLPTLEIERTIYTGSGAAFEMMWASGSSPSHGRHRAFNVRFDIA
jgi:hypothetical protein